MYNFENQSVAIIGDTPDIVDDLARRFLLAGANVGSCFIWANRGLPPPHLPKVKKGKRVINAGAEPNNLGQLEQFIDDTCDAFGKIDILVNTTGVAAVASDMLLTETQWDQSLSLKNVFFCSRHMAQKWIDKGCGGVIVNALLFDSPVWGGGNIPCGMEKAGYTMMTQRLARALEPRGIRVNAIDFRPYSAATLSSGPQEGPELQKAISAKRQKKEDNTSSPIVNGVLFLASEKACCITGHILSLDVSEPAAALR